MTRQMTDDEVLRVFDEARMHMEGRLNSAGAREITDSRLAEARAAVAALQAERDALRAEIEMHRNDAARLNGCPWRVQKGLQSECQPPKNMRESLAALEALRGQVAGLVDKWRAESNALPTLSHKGAGLDRGIKELSELLAIKDTK